MVASVPVTEDEDLMLVTDGGQLIRMRIADIRIVGRNSKGVILFRLGEGEKVVSASVFKQVNGDETTGEADDLSQVTPDIDDSQENNQQEEKNDEENI